MSTSPAAPANIDEYIAGFAPEVQEVLRQIRSTIKQAAPDAEETIKYLMPTFMSNGNLVYFAAFKKHIGFYPPVRDEELKAEASVYEGPKGALRFPLSEPMPLDLIRRIVLSRVTENLESMRAKR